MTEVFDLAHALVWKLSDPALEEDTIVASKLAELESARALDVLLRTARALVGRFINRHCRLNRIPPELLTHIFSFVLNDGQGNRQYRDPQHPSWSPRGPAGQPRNLVPLTAVCQRWRNILLETPLLWSTVDDHVRFEVPHFTYYIHRCPRGPLFVHLHEWPHRKILRLLESHGERVQDLFMNKCGASHIIDLFKAEELQRCRLKFSCGDYAGGPFHALFQGRAPKLQRLQLEGSPFLPSNHFPSLTHLILACHPIVFFSAEDLQVFLSGCPRLESLYIKTRDISQIQVPEKSPTARSPRLLHLRIFSMIATADWQDGQNFSFGNEPATQAELSEFRDKHSALQYALLSAAVQVPQCLVYFNPIASANLQICADHLSTLIRPSCMRIVETATASFTPNRLSLELVHPSEPQGVRFDLQLDRDGEDVETARQNLQRAMATSPLFSDIHELHMHSGSSVFLCPPHSILRSLPSLKYLIFGFDELKKAARNSILDTLSDVDGGSVVCPQLDSLWIVFPDGVSTKPHIE
ncbi:hypothetical protein VTO73DRAFT_10831 [Trametes versicolor]